MRDKANQIEIKTKKIMSDYMNLLGIESCAITITDYTLLREQAMREIDWEAGLVHLSGGDSNISFGKVENTNAMHGQPVPTMKLEDLQGHTPPPKVEKAPVEQNLKIVPAEKQEPIPITVKQETVKTEKKVEEKPPWEIVEDKPKDGMSKEERMRIELELLTGMAD